MAKAWSTKIPRPVIRSEFEDVFVQYGHRVTEHVYGKRCTTRSLAQFGKDRLEDMRRAFTRGLA